MTDHSPDALRHIARQKWFDAAAPSKAALKVLEDLAGPQTAEQRAIAEPIYERAGPDIANRVRRNLAKVRSPWPQQTPSPGPRIVRDLGEPLKEGEHPNEVVFLVEDFARLWGLSADEFAIEIASGRLGMHAHPQDRNKPAKMVIGFKEMERWLRHAPDNDPTGAITRTIARMEEMAR